MQKTIKIYDFTKDAAISTRDGKIVRDKIEQELRNQNTVVLDFNNVSIILMKFLEIAIGELYRNHSHDFMMEKISVVDMIYPEKWRAAIRNGRKKYKR